jgi:hypothetical protein
MHPTLGLSDRSRPFVSQLIRRESSARRSGDGTLMPHGQLAATGCCWLRRAASHTEYWIFELVKTSSCHSHTGLGLRAAGYHGQAPFR